MNEEQAFIVRHEDNAGPMKEILINTNVMLDTSLLLERGENYASGGVITNREGEKIESIAERLDKIYEAVFGRNSFNESRYIDIGQMRFTATTREEVERITSVLSPLTDFNQL